MCVVWSNNLWTASHQCCCCRYCCRVGKTVILINGHFSLLSIFLLWVQFFCSIFVFCAIPKRYTTRSSTAGVTQTIEVTHSSTTQHRRIESTHMHLFNGDNMIIIIIVLCPPPFINTSTHKRRNTGITLIFRSRVSCRFSLICTCVSLQQTLLHWYGTISSTNSARKECNDSKRIYRDVIVCP